MLMHGAFSFINTILLFSPLVLTPRTRSSPSALHLLLCHTTLLLCHSHSPLLLLHSRVCYRELLLPQFLLLLPPNHSAVKLYFVVFHQVVTINRLDPKQQTEESGTVASEQKPPRPVCFCYRLSAAILTGVGALGYEETHELLSGL